MRACSSGKRRTQGAGQSLISFVSQQVQLVACDQLPGLSSLSPVASLLLQQLFLIWDAWALDRPPPAHPPPILCVREGGRMDGFPTDDQRNWVVELGEDRLL